MNAIKTESAARRKRAEARRQYQKRKTRGACAYFGCKKKPKIDRLYCHRHLANMAKQNRRRCKARKDQGLCIYCGIRPQFWGVRCIICRQIFTKDILPFGARRALRLYREAERQFLLEQGQVEAKFAVRKLLAAEAVTGRQARVLRLYVGLDKGDWRTYEEVGKIMNITKERVRQLLYPSRVLLAKMLGDMTSRKSMSTWTTLFGPIPQGTKVCIKPRKPVSVA